MPVSVGDTAMTEDQQATVLRHTALVARHFVAFRCGGDKLVELIRYSIGELAPDADAIGLFLRKAETINTLEREYEVAYWISSDRNRSHRLVSLAVPDNVADAAALLERKPPSSSHCAFCFQHEIGYTVELEKAYGIDGASIPGIALHRQCQRPYKLLMDLVARNGR